MATTKPYLSNPLSRLAWLTFFYTFALFNWFFYLLLGLKSGTFFHRPTEQERLRLAICAWTVSRLHQSRQLTDSSTRSILESVQAATPRLSPCFLFTSLRRPTTLHHEPCRHRFSKRWELDDILSRLS